MKNVDCYLPGGSFPSISITGDTCALSCPHCAALPLKSMIDARSPGGLESIAQGLAARGALGFLLSGGCDSSGKLPLENYVRCLSRIKASTELKVNVHLGYPGKRLCEELVASGVDSFSVNYPLSDRIGESLYQTKNALERYHSTIDALRSAGAERIVPHILIGASDPSSELEGIGRLGKSPPRSLVFIVFRPLKGTPWSDRKPAPDQHVVDVISEARGLMPSARIVLGCMRPKGNAELERALIESSLDGIVLPSMKAMAAVEGKTALIKKPGCCSLYL